MNRKADYNEIAAYYDKGRTLSDANIDLWLDLVKRMSGAGPGARVLDLGCGTGRFAIPFAEILGCRVTGCDASTEMLVKAGEKDTGNKVTWDVQDAHQLSYPGDTFDIVFMSLVLHHCEDPLQVMKEIHRVLAPGGVFLLRHAIYDEIKDDPEYIFFPESREIDEARLISLDKILSLLREAGFNETVSESIVQQSSVNGEELLRKFAGKSISTLSMIPEAAFQRGLAKLKEYVKEHPDDPWLQNDRLRMTVARKHA